jgi:cyclopropane-fatty-acyl-phospholipid synthase
MDNWWRAEALDQFVDKILRADLQCRVKKNRTFFMNWFLAKMFNRQSGSRAFMVGETHYDVGNDLYKRMLDRRMLYTCAYWKNAPDLDQAQENKLRLICEKILLAPGMRVLDLGCGYGAFARYAAEMYNVHVTGYTVSREQANLGREMCRGLDVELKLDDYRNAAGRFDRVVSIGIMEHVGPKNYGTYMQKVHETLTDDGISLIHTIGHNQTRPVTNIWTEKYIFPNGKLPSIAQLGTAMENGFVMEDWHNFGEDYDKTLMAWHHNFKTTWHEIKDRYSDRFYRMWEFYLLSCAGAFRARHIQLWQIVMTRTGRPAPECRKV